MACGPGNVSHRNIAQPKVLQSIIPVALERKPVGVIDGGFRSTELVNEAVVVEIYSDPESCYRE